MSPSIVLVQLLSGLAHAMVLFLIASGLSLIFGVTRVVNFAHGSLYMLAAYLTYTLTSLLPFGAASFYVAVIAAALAVGVVGLVIEVALLRRVYRAPELYQLLLTFALVLVIADVVKLVWGSDNPTGPSAPRLAGSVPGALLASNLIGGIDAFGVLVLPKASLVMTFAVMAVVLIVRPWGLLGRPEAQGRGAGTTVAASDPRGIPRAWIVAMLVALAVI